MACSTLPPDSFSDGSLYTDIRAALAHVHELFAQGADLLDIGAESTNPRSEPISAEHEIERLKPLLPKLIKQFGSNKFTLDTYHPETLAWALSQGLEPILNDVSGLHNPAMRQLVLRNSLRVIISHLPKPAGGIPSKAHTAKYTDSIEQVVAELLDVAGHLEKQGLSKTNIILDPGIGFGKTMCLNWQLLNFPKYVPDYSVMLGYSRKRFLYTDPYDGSPATHALQLKTNASKDSATREAHERWLREQHKKILKSILGSSTNHSQSIYLRLHQISR